MCVSVPRLSLKNRPLAGQAQHARSKQPRRWAVEEEPAMTAPVVTPPMDADEPGYDVKAEVKAEEPQEGVDVKEKPLRLLPPLSVRCI